MKEKNLINGGELERIDSKLFNSLDPEDESWICGGMTCLTVISTFTPTGSDMQYDYDYPEIEGFSS